MNNMEFTYNGHTYKRITRTNAKKAYNNGLSVFVFPCRLRPGTAWTGNGVVFHKDPEKEPFENWENAFRFYNCSHETGYYPSYYIPVIHVDRFTGNPVPESTYGAVESYDYSVLGVEK